ncbi:MAG: peptide chain release factor-like protein [Deltaproteobacteria bacterium]|nr:peptide chain release factor-like protein [Deltaproteobacteria bacterium]
MNAPGEEEVVLREGDLEITFFKSSGPGGQHKNKRETAVRIRHLPTGITVTATEERSQLLNRQAALGRLEAKLERLRRKRKRRIATAPTRASRERRLEAKKLHGRKKAARSGSVHEG